MAEMVETSSASQSMAINGQPLDVKRRNPLRVVAQQWRFLTGFERTIVISMAIILILTVIGPWIAPQPTTTAAPLNRLLPPSGAHWFGTDSNGMDVFSRILASFRIDVAIAVIATGISVIVGSALGVLIAQLEGARGKARVSRLTAEGSLRLLDVIQAFPVFVFAMVLVAIRGTSTANIVAAIAFVNLPVFIRLVRSEVRSLQQQPYAEAAEAIGNSRFRIGYRHLLPNAVPAVIVQISVTVGFAILLTAGLSFVGAGISPPTPELGAMISGGARFLITGQWWPAFFPGIFLAYTVFTFALFGEIFGKALTQRVGDDDDNTAIEIASLDPRVSSATGGVTGVTSVVNESADHLGVPSEAVELRHSHPRQPVIHHGEPHAPTDAILSVQNLTVEFDRLANMSRPAVDDVSIDIAPGERVGIVGETGSGKSLLVKAILGILPENARVTAGEILVEGESFLDLPPKEIRARRGKSLAAILPNPKAQLNPLVRVGNLMMASLRAHDKLSKDEALERCRLALEQVGISDPDRRLRQYPHELSGGMAQRVCIALSLLHDPQLLIADEPTAGLDVTVQRQVLDLLSQLSETNRASQFIVTRDLSIVAHFCSRVGVMYQGRLVELGPTMAVFDAPQHAHTQALLDAVRVDGSRRSSSV
jgi:peptide/nickel transport system permease protein